jgi:voltage-gated potassium channel
MAAPPAEIERGQPRSEHDAEVMARFDARMRLPLIVSAILPLIVVPETGNWVSVVIGVVTWVVFLVDYLMHRRHLFKYQRTRLGRFDLFVVIATAPWFLIPGAQAGSVVVILRLARLARLLMATRRTRRLFDRVGKVAGVAVGVTITGSFVAYYAEHATNPEFATVGDSLWWGVVTLTTVGYGDIVPKTPTGRWAGVAIMITGIAVLGLLSGTLASFFGLGQGDTTSAADSDGDEGAGGRAGGGELVNPEAASSSESALAALTAEMQALRRQVEELSTRLAGGGGAPPSGLGEPGGAATD